MLWSKIAAFGQEFLSETRRGPENVDTTFELIRNFQMWLKRNLLTINLGFFATPWRQSSSLVTPLALAVRRRHIMILPPLQTVER